MTYSARPTLIIIVSTRFRVGTNVRVSMRSGAATMTVGALVFADGFRLTVNDPPQRSPAAERNVHLGGGQAKERRREESLKPASRNCRDPEGGFTDFVCLPEVKKSAPGPGSCSNLVVRVPKRSVSRPADASRCDTLRQTLRTLRWKAFYPQRKRKFHAT